MAGTGLNLLGANPRASKGTRWLELEDVAMAGQVQDKAWEGTRGLHPFSEDVFLF